MPHEHMRLSASRTVLGEKMRLLVTGHTPPLASVAATTLNMSHVHSIEQHMK